MYKVSENSRRLFAKVAFYGPTLNNIDRLFESHGFNLPDGVEPAQRRELRVGQYHATVDWEDPEQVRRILQVYQATLDEFGKPLGNFLSPQASSLLKALERDGNFVADDEIVILEPEFEIEGPIGLTGWKQIDRELIQLKLDFGSAIEPNDYQALALRCLTILRLLSDELYDEVRHLVGDTVPGAADLKARLDQYVQSVAGGSRFEHVRKLVRNAYDQANAVKHRKQPERVDAGIVAAATILLAEMLRLISDMEAEAQLAG